MPPRIELVYRGFLGTQVFFIGDAVYRLEHGDSRYTITTIGEARGLAALFLRGQGRLTSSGTITSAGLQPDLYTAERSSDGRREAATFDWESGIVLLNGDRTAGLELPTFDPLAALWQFYFAPPERDEAEFNVATTRRVYHSRFHRTGVERVKLSFAEVDAEVWERTSGDGNITARVWLAPSLHHVMVKIRLSNGRLTGEALLDSIRSRRLPTRLPPCCRSKSRPTSRSAISSALIDSSGSTTAHSSPTAYSRCCGDAAR